MSSPYKAVPETKGGDHHLAQVLSYLFSKKHHVRHPENKETL